MNCLKNVIIRGISIFHPNTICDNEYYVDFFKERGIKEEKSRYIMEKVLGRKKRYVINDNSGENSLTMAIKAAKVVLEKTHLKGNDIDVICLASFTSEYSVPPTAFKIHNAIDGKESAICYDLNANCIGVALAFEQIVRYISTNQRINKVLLIGSEYMTYMNNPDNITFYAAFGDSALAMILEKSTNCCGLISSRYKIDKGYSDRALGPFCGYSHLLDAKPEQIFHMMKGAKFDYVSAKNKILDMLEEVKVDVSAIKVFCVSQFCEDIVMGMRKELKVNDMVIPYIGDKYGYTGGNSPFLVLYHEILKGRVIHGDYIFIWNVGYALQEIFLLIKY